MIWCFHTKLNRSDQKCMLDKQTPFSSCCFFLFFVCVSCGELSQRRMLFEALKACRRHDLSRPQHPPTVLPFNQPLCSGCCSPTRRLPLSEEVLLGDQPDAASFLLGFAQGGQSNLIPAEVPEKQEKAFVKEG